jgi:CubicO group peptidase (beta-lactamase class C family)
MQTDSIFRISSHTKAVVSVVTMILQEHGLLHINQPVSRYLPEFANTSVAVAEPGGGYYIKPANQQITIRETVRRIASLPFDGHPGRRGLVIDSLGL